MSAPVLYTRIGGCTLLLFVPALLRADDEAGVRFFEQKVRPVLVQHCYSCHSTKSGKARGGLRLDTRAGLLTGGDSGPAVVPGKAADSLLIKAVRHEDVAMPPKGKLPAEVIADLERWVTMGAPDPRAESSRPARRPPDVEAGRTFWAYQPPRLPATPAVKDAAWCDGEIDRFILARLERSGLRPAADADRATLIRRLCFDLHGLPPTPDQIDEFVQDRSPAAYEKVVDRLLASPRFGERWGRHWLDVARYAESLTLRGFVLKEAWRYRDYVIDAFNRDLPFDRFMAEQVAGDLLPAATPADRGRQLVAATFLTLGNTNLEEQDKQQLRMDVVDEQLDTIGRGFLGQTIGCARCHDHKFDPIPTADYYALAGILRNTVTLEHANVSRWLEIPLPTEPAQEAVLRAHEAAVTALQGRIKPVRDWIAAANKPGPGRTGVIAVKDLPGIVVDDSQARKVGEWKTSQYSGTYIGAGYVHDAGTGKGEKTLTFQPEFTAAGTYEVRLAYSPGANRATDVPVTVFSADGEHTIRVDERKPPPIEGLFISLGQYKFEKSNQGFVLIANADTNGVVVADAVLFIPAEMLSHQPARTSETVDSRKLREDRDTLRALEAELKTLQAVGPKRPMVMTVREAKEIADTSVHIRGNVHTLGAKVPRGFLRVATPGPAPALPAAESGRRQLGEWLADRANPLPARVIVNRVWHWLFGAGIVRTTDNFGTTGERPSHPELLDHLAVRFVEEGWSVKALVRHLVLSHTYRLASGGAPPAADPENRLLSRMNRRRLDAECIRDAILSVGGTLRFGRGGPGFPETLDSDFGYHHADTRRSVYVPVFRNALPEIFEVFDFADPSVSTGQRPVSTVSLQALFMLNSPFVLDQTRAAADRLLADPGVTDDQRVTSAYRLALGRMPTADERRVAVRFLGPGGTGRRESWTLLCQALFASMDFRYVN